MLKKMYYWLYSRFTKPGERGEYSGGYLQNKVREQSLSLCRDAAGRVLEVGCGEGLFIVQLAARYPHLEIWGVDNNVKRIKQAEERAKTCDLKNVRFLLQEAPCLKFEDGYFDIVVCVNVFFNMPSFESVLKTLGRIKRITKMGGRIIFDFRNSLNVFLKLKYKLAKYYDETTKYLPLNTYSPKQIESVLRELNFSIINRKCIGFFINIMAPIIIVEAKKNA